jgi:hypothetical protein
MPVNISRPARLGHALCVLCVLLPSHLQAQAREDTVAVLVAVLRAEVRDTVILSERAPTLLLGAAQSAGLAAVRPTRTVICTSDGAREDDIEGSFFSVRLSPPVTAGALFGGDSVAITFSSSGFQLERDRAQVPIHTWCYRVGGGGGGLSSWVDGRWLTSFQSGTTLVLERVDGEWAVTGRIGFFIT